MSFDGAFAWDVIRALGTGTYTVVRRSASTIVKGKPVRSLQTQEFEIEASIQPASGRDLLRLPEGRRTTETRVLYTTTLLQTGGEGEPVEADRVKIGDEQWEVQNAEPWPGHYRCMIQLAAKGQGP